MTGWSVGAPLSADGSGGWRRMRFDGGVRVLVAFDGAPSHVRSLVTAIAGEPGFEVRTFDMTSWSAHTAFEPEAFHTLDRDAWLAQARPRDAARARYGDVILCRAGGYGGVWLSRMRERAPLVLHVRADDLVGPSLHLIDWTGVALVIVDSKGVREGLRARHGPQLPTGLTIEVVEPVRRPPSAFPDPLSEARTVLLAPEVTTEPGLLFGLDLLSALRRRDPDWTMSVRMVAAPASGRPLLDARRADRLQHALKGSLGHGLRVIDAMEPPPCAFVVEPMATPRDPARLIDAVMNGALPFQLAATPYTPPRFDGENDRRFTTLAGLVKALEALAALPLEETNAHREAMARAARQRFAVDAPRRLFGVLQRVARVAASDFP